MLVNTFCAWYYFIMINNDRSVGQRIKAAREKEGMTQSELAKALGYNSPTAISLIESGERSAKITILEKIAKLLHQDFQYLSTGSNTNILTFRTALRADESFDASDVAQIENYIDFLMAQKSKDDGRGTPKAQG